MKNFTREALGRPWSLLSGLGVGSSVGCVVSFFFPNGQKRLKSSKSLGLKIATLQKLAVLPVLPVLPFTLYKRCSFCWGVSVWGRRVTPGFSKKTKLWSSVKAPPFWYSECEWNIYLLHEWLNFFLVVNLGEYSSFIQSIWLKGCLPPSWHWYTFFLNKRQMWWLKKGEVYQPIYNPIQRVYPNFQGKFTQFPGSKIQNCSLIW